eukprot:884822-Pelagomonas_calceolata.AAC.2
MHFLQHGVATDAGALNKEYSSICKLWNEHTGFHGSMNEHVMWFPVSMNRKFQLHGRVVFKPGRREVNLSFITPPHLSNWEGSLVTLQGTCMKIANRVQTPLRLCSCSLTLIHACMLARCCMMQGKNNLLALQKAILKAAPVS